MVYRRPLSPPELCRIPTVLNCSIGSAQQSPLCCTPLLCSVFLRQNISFSLLFPHTDPFPPGLHCAHRALPAVPALNPPHCEVTSEVTSWAAWCGGQHLACPGQAHSLLGEGNVVVSTLFNEEAGGLIQQQSSLSCIAAGV